MNDENMSLEYLLSYMMHPANRGRDFHFAIKIPEDKRFYKIVRKGR